MIPANSGRDVTKRTAAGRRSSSRRRAAPILGDAHLGNVFITPEGALWNDFEDA
jgi:hypothetical protein